MKPEDGSDAHAWFRSRLEWAALEGLDEQERARFDEHAASCADCRRRLELHRTAKSSALPFDSRHLPPPLAARWSRVAPTLTGLELEMVQEHMRSCAICREGIQRLGGDPDLLEKTPKPAPVLLSLPATKDRRWLDRMIGATAGATLATAAAVAVVSTLSRTDLKESARSQPRKAPIDEPGFAPAMPHQFTIALVDPAPKVKAFEDASRGIPAHEAPDVILDVAADAHFVQFPLPLILTGAMIEVAVAGPDSAILARQVQPVGRIKSTSRIVFGDASRPLETGRYRLDVIVTPAAGFSSAPDVYTTHFVLRRRPSGPMGQR